jgi:hypothetical protein
MSNETHDPKAKCWRCETPAEWADYKSSRTPARYTACADCFIRLIDFLDAIHRGRTIVERIKPS